MAGDRYRAGSPYAITSVAERMAANARRFAATLDAPLHLTTDSHTYTAEDQPRQRAEPLRTWCA